MLCKYWYYILYMIYNISNIVKGLYNIYSIANLCSNEHIHTYYAITQSGNVSCSNVFEIDKRVFG